MGDIFNFKMEWTGLDELEKKFDNMDKRTAEEVAFAMVENTEALLGKSMRIAPIDEGHMVGSASAKVNSIETAVGDKEGNLKHVKGKPKPNKITIGEVSFNAPYAARQHEDLTLRHLPGRQAKYLEQPLKEFTTKFMENIKEALEKGMQRGVR